MYFLPSTFKVPGSRLPGETPFNCTPHSAANNALAVTSKQRAISVELMHTVARLLRTVAPQLEAAALRDAMQDDNANEFVAAIMAQAEASTSGDSGVTTSASTLPSVSFLQNSSVGMPAGGHPLNADGTPNTVRLATVLRTRTATAGAEERAATPTAHSMQDNTTTFGSLHVRNRPRLSSTTSSFKADGRQDSTRTVPSSPSAADRSHDAPTAVLRPNSHSPSHAPQAAAAANTLCFAADWFDTAALTRLSRLHPVATTSMENLSEHRMDLPPLLSTPPPPAYSRQGVLAVFPASGETSTTSAASISDAAHSLPTLVFPTSNTPLATTTPARPHVANHRGGGSPLRAPPSPTLSRSHATATGERGPLDSFTTVTTAQPPLYVDGMLLDPESGRFLFGGHVFREEARVLYVPSTIPAPPGMRDASMTGSSASSAVAMVAAAAQQRHTAGRMSTTVAPSTASSRNDAACLLLLREYFPVSVTVAVPDNGADNGHELTSIDAAATAPDDIVVQCYSMLPPWLTQVPPNRYHLLPESVTIACVCQAAPGCVTAVTSLSRFLRGDGVMSAAGNSFTSHPGSPFVNTISALGGLLRMPGTTHLSATGAQDSRHAEQAMLSHYNQIDAGAMHNSNDPRQSLAQSIEAAPLVPGRKDLDAARIITVAERLSVVPPDVLDDALAAVHHCLAFYFDYTVRRQRIRDVLAAVRVVQCFFRRCLAIKRRAVRRMMRVWRKLEVEARLKLQQHRALPSAVERIDTVANGILQDHMLTSVDYKRAFIQDEWNRRRAAFALWTEAEDWHLLFSEEGQQEGDEAAVAVSSSARRSTNTSTNTTVAAATRADSGRARRARLTAEEEQHMSDAFAKRSEVALLPKAAATFSDASPLVPAAVAAVGASPARGKVEARRRDAALRRYRSWYIDPHELLFLSHQRLLQTLKTTVLRMEEVQSELNRAVVDIGRDAAGHVTSNGA